MGLVLLLWLLFSAPGSDHATARCNAVLDVDDFLPGERESAPERDGVRASGSGDFFPAEVNNCAARQNIRLGQALIVVLLMAPAAGVLAARREERA